MKNMEWEVRFAAMKMGAADIFPLRPEGISGDQYLVLKPAGRLGE